MVEKKKAKIAKQRSRIHELEGTVKDLEAQLQKKQKNHKPKASTRSTGVSEEDKIIKEQQEKIIYLEGREKELKESLKAMQVKSKVAQRGRTCGNKGETSNVVQTEDIDVGIKSGHKGKVDDDTQRRKKDASPTRNSKGKGKHPGSQQTFCKKETHTATFTKSKGRPALKTCPRDIITHKLVETTDGKKPRTFVQVIIGKIENFVKWLYEIKEKFKKVKTEHVERVEVRKGSLVITFVVEETHKITEKWIQSLLDIVFEDVLGEYIPEGERSDVTIVWQEIWPVAMTEPVSSRTPKKKGFAEEVTAVEKKPGPVAMTEPVSSRTPKKKGFAEEVTAVEKKPATYAEKMRKSRKPNDVQKEERKLELVYGQTH